jgi:hypothetical protein
LYYVYCELYHVRGVDPFTMYTESDNIVIMILLDSVTIDKYA